MYKRNFKKYVDRIQKFRTHLTGFLEIIAENNSRQNVEEKITSEIKEENFSEKKDIKFPIQRL